MKLSVVLPVYSETESLISVIGGLTELVGNVIHEIIIIVSAESQRETFEVCQRLVEKDSKVKVYIQNDKGLGNAVRQGISYVTGTYVLLMDSDGEMLPATVPNLIEKIRDEYCDVVVASRWIKGGGAIGYSTLKYVFTQVYNAVFRFLYRTRIHDLSLGFKLMRVEVVKTIPWEGERHEIATETTLKPIRLGYKVEEVPTIWIRRQFGKSKNWMLANVRYIRMALKIWRRKGPVW